MEKLYTPIKNCFTIKDLPDEIPKGKIKYVIGVKPIDNYKMLEKLRQALVHMTIGGRFPVKVYSNYENITNIYKDLKITKLEIAKKFNSFGRIPIYLTLNKDIGACVQRIEHKLTIKSWVSGVFDPSIEFVFFMENDSFKTFVFDY